MRRILDQLRNDLGYRRIRAGIETLESLRPEIGSLSPGDPHAGIFLGLIAQWVDAGFDSPSLLIELLERFPTAVRGALPLIDYLHTRMAEGVAAMAHEEFESAAAHLRFVLSLEAEICDPELLAIANFWAGRCMRRMGRYDEALPYILRGEELALSCGYLQMAAITQVTQSWLAFQNGRLTDALVILRRAEEALSQTDDFLNRGNIQSAYGRIARRQGQYDCAMESFERALTEYRAGGGGQLQMARTLQNLAFVKRLCALRLQKELDLNASSRRSGAAVSSETAALRGRIEQTRSQAGAHVDESMAVYERLGNHRGIAGGHIIRGFLRLDAGDLESAAEEAAGAFQHGEEKRDNFVMARARTLQCMVEHAALEEQVGDAVGHCDAAAAFARDAVTYASHTENRRLLARALIWNGLSLGVAPDSDSESVRRLCERASALLQPEAGEQQYPWEEFEKLKEIVLRSSPIEPRLRAWSAGIVSNASFQELTEEFARVVIPKVWEREGRKISRVANKLSISPKKVRRILQSVGKLK